MNESTTDLIKQGESISLEFKETFDRETIETVVNTHLKMYQKYA
jgi:hypothetical protein